ncbi:H-NS histone family protein [Bradyrhizobium sp. CCGB20]|uniref:H-NS histone family protein n=1 Tax=Bradyrhizobium sp. CCGB20 TaxID=2949633 RepID=UPI00281176BC|nr:H-NS histone family protein [Bradyrhizobium sp. CCGB20]
MSLFVSRPSSCRLFRERLSNDVEFPVWQIAMKMTGLKSMSVDELWSLHEKVSAALARRITAETVKRLRTIGAVDKLARTGRKRRPYPPVRPEYRNPKNPVQTCSGRGKLPRWLSPQLRAGRTLEYFLIDRSRRKRRHKA